MHSLRVTIFYENKTVRLIISIGWCTDIFVRHWAIITVSLCVIVENPISSCPVYMDVFHLKILDFMVTACNMDSIVFGVVKVYIFEFDILQVIICTACNMDCSLSVSPEIALNTRSTVVYTTSVDGYIVKFVIVFSTESFTCKIAINS